MTADAKESLHGSERLERVRLLPLPLSAVNKHKVLQKRSVVERHELDGRLYRESRMTLYEFNSRTLFGGLNKSVEYVSS